MNRFLTYLLAGISAAVLTLFTCGCESLSVDDESDLPWNTPQPWEGAPSIPGLDGY